MPSLGDFSSDGLIDDIIEAALQYEGEFRNAFIGYINAAASDPILLDILQDIADGEIVDLTLGVEQRLAEINVSLDDLNEILTDAMRSVGNRTVSSVGIEMQFDMTMPDAIEFASQLSGRLITGVEATVRDSIRGVLEQVLQSDMTLQQMRRFVKNRVGLLPAHSQAVTRYFDQLIVDGVDPTRARRLAAEYANRLLNYRADMITRTELAAAQSYGQWAVWKQMQRDGVVPFDSYRVWLTAQDERTCDLCGPMNLQVAPIDGPWMTPNGPVFVPTDMHPNCRCASGLTFSRGRAREFINKGPDTEFDWWLIEKHLAGSTQDHDQSTHGRRRKLEAYVTFGGEYMDWAMANGVAGYPYEYADEGDFSDEWHQAGEFISRGLKDHVARAVGADVLDTMDTYEMAVAVAELEEKSGESGVMLDPFLGTYDLDIVSALTLMDQMGRRSEYQTLDAWGSLARVVASKGEDWLPVTGPDGRLQILDAAGNVVEGAVVTVGEVYKEATRQSQWMLEKAREVLGDDHEVVQELETGIQILNRTKVGFESQDENLVGRGKPVNYPSERGTLSSDMETIGTKGPSSALANNTVNAVVKIVGKYMEGGEENRAAAAQFVVDANRETGMEIGTRFFSNGLSLSLVPSTGLSPRLTDEEVGYYEPENFANEIASRLVQSWAVSSSSPESSLMMQAAVTELGASPGYSPDNYALGRKVNLRLEDLSVPTQKLIRTVVRTQYDNTQKMFRDMGIDEVTIARGMSFGSELPYKRVDGKIVYEAQAVLRPLSAWAVDIVDAANFAKGSQILFQKVPVERIFATPMTGIGCFNESEAIFIFKDGDVFPIIDMSMTISSGSRVNDFVDLMKLINEYDIPSISKAELPVIYPDANIEDADWAKRTFNFPGVTTADQYREEFGLEDAEALANHIKDVKDLPYWQGVPSKIKTALLKARIAKHLGNEHDQMTHGRRKTGARWSKEELRSRKPRLGATASAVEKLIVGEGRLSQEAIARGLESWSKSSSYYGEKTIAELVGRIGEYWNDYGNEDSTVSTFVDAIRNVLPRERGVEFSEEFDSPYRGSSEYGDLDKDGQDLFDAVALAYYDTTQKLLAQEGIEAVRLWRGMTFEVDDTTFPGTDVPLSQATVSGTTLSSWAHEWSIGRHFSKTSFKPVLLHAMVPAKYIFSVAYETGGAQQYNLGSLVEAEVVVLGGTFEVDVLTRDYSEQEVDRVLTGERSPFREGEEVDKAERKVINIDKDPANMNWLRKKVSKHLGSQHDQMTHGRRKTAAGGVAEYTTKVGKVVDANPSPSNWAEVKAASGDNMNLRESMDYASSIFSLKIKRPGGSIVEAVVLRASDNFNNGMEVSGVITLDGEQVGRFVRFLQPPSDDEMTMNNSNFGLDESLQGQGIGTTILRHWEDQLARAGFTKMFVGAQSGSGSNGAYTWAKYGYSFTNDKDPDRIFSNFVYSIMKDAPNPREIGLVYATGWAKLTGHSVDDVMGQLERMAAGNLDGFGYGNYKSDPSPLGSNGKVRSPLAMIVELPGMAEYLKTARLQWTGVKETELLDISKSMDEVLAVIRRWEVEDPAGFESDDPKFWEEVYEAYGRNGKS